MSRVTTFMLLALFAIAALGCSGPGLQGHPHGGPPGQMKKHGNAKGNQAEIEVRARI